MLRPEDTQTQAPKEFPPKEQDTLPQGQQYTEESSQERSSATVSETKSSGGGFMGGLKDALGLSNKDKETESSHTRTVRTACVIVSSLGMLYLTLVLLFSIFACFPLYNHHLDAVQRHSCILRRCCLVSRVRSTHNYVHFFADEDRL